MVSVQSSLDAVMVLKYCCVQPPASQARIRSAILCVQSRCVQSVTQVSQCQGLRKRGCLFLFQSPPSNEDSRCVHLHHCVDTYPPRIPRFTAARWPKCPKSWLLLRVTNQMVRSVLVSVCFYKRQLFSPCVWRRGGGFWLFFVVFFGFFGFFFPVTYQTTPVYARMRQHLRVACNSSIWNRNTTFYFIPPPPQKGYRWGPLD